MPKIANGNVLPTEFNPFFSHTICHSMIRYIGRTEWGRKVIA